MRSPVLALMLAFCLGTISAASAASGPKEHTALDKPTLESYLRHYFVWSSQVKVEIDVPQPAPFPGFLEIAVHASAGDQTQDEVFYVSKDGQKLVRGNVYDIKENPFHNELKKLKTEFQPSIGTPGASVVVVMFSDFQCPFCREEAKMIRQNLLSAYPKHVRLYFKDFPLEQIHPWSKMASIAGRCIFRQNPGVFWQFYDWVFEHQADITPENLKAKVLEFAKSKSDVLDSLQLERCIQTRATEAEIDKNIADAKALKVLSIPTLFINGRRVVGNQGWPALRQVIDYEIEYQKTAHDAGEDCGCELKLPSPLANP
jgi:protein-disulfide isomerase